MPVKIEIPDNHRITREEEYLDHLDYIMSCASENILGECKYELDKLIQTIKDSQTLTQDQINITSGDLDIIHDLLNAKAPNLIEINNLFWKLHKKLRDATYEAIRKSCYENITIKFN
jgi:hypothetical protein